MKRALEKQLWPVDSLWTRMPTTVVLLSQCERFATLGRQAPCVELAGRFDDAVFANQVGVRKPWTFARLIVPGKKVLAYIVLAALMISP